MSDRIECPFMCLFGTVINCPHIENFTYCHDVGIAPGNGDAWCARMIKIALNKIKEGPLMRQNYSCILCGLKSFVTYSASEDEFAVAIKIGEDHKKREPTCPCPVNDLYIAGEFTEI